MDGCGFRIWTVPTHRQKDRRPAGQSLHIFFRARRLPAELCVSLCLAHSRMALLTARSHAQKADRIGDCDRGRFWTSTTATVSGHAARARSARGKKNDYADRGKNNVAEERSRLHQGKKSRIQGPVSPSVGHSLSLTHTEQFLMRGCQKSK